MSEDIGGYTRYTSAEKGFFAEGGDAWHALTISDNMQIVLDPKGFIIDIWDSETKKRYHNLGYEIDTRDTPYDLGAGPPNPADMTDEELENALRRINNDYSAECRIIRTMQASLKDKDKRMRELVGEMFRKLWAAAGKSGYQHRVVPTLTMMIAAGAAFGYRAVCTNSYAHRYVPGGRSSFYQG